MLTVTVDLVSGGPVVRETGDATRGILESINLPGLSSPIIGDGEALVDGGLVNNIPADVLVGKGCNFVLASSVTAKLEREFVGIRPGQSIQKHGSPSFLKVLLRGHLVQSFNMNAVGVQPADFVIEPDVTAFDLSEFERTDEMAAIGERTTVESLAQIRQLLSKLDPHLFPAT
jgi:predicted acylesterase/phospholipase RssA